MKKMFLFLCGVLLFCCASVMSAEKLPEWPGIHVNFRPGEPIKLERGVKKTISLQDFADVRVDSPVTCSINLSSAYTSPIVFATIPKNWNGTDTIPLIYDTTKINSDDNDPILFYISGFEIDPFHLSQMPFGYVKQKKTFCERGNYRCFYFPPNQKNFEYPSPFFLPAGVDTGGQAIYKPYGMFPAPWDVILSNQPDQLFTCSTLFIKFYRRSTKVSYGRHTLFKSCSFDFKRYDSISDFFPPEKSKIRIAFDPNKSLEVYSDSPHVFNLLDYAIVSVTDKIDEDKVINISGLKGTIPAHWNRVDSIMMTFTVHDNPRTARTDYNISTLKHSDIYIIPMLPLNYTIIRTQPLLNVQNTNVTYGKGISEIPLIFTLSKKQTQPVNFSIQPAYDSMPRVLESFPYSVTIPKNTDSVTVMLKMNTEPPFNKVENDLLFKLLHNSKSPGEYALGNAMFSVEVKFPPETRIDSQVVMRFQKNSDSPIRVKYGDAFPIPVILASADSSLADSDILKNRELAYTLTLLPSYFRQYEVEYSDSTYRMILSRGHDNISLRIKDPTQMAFISATRYLEKDQEVTIKLNAYTDGKNIMSPLVGEPSELKLILEKCPDSFRYQENENLINIYGNSSDEYAEAPPKKLPAEQWTDSSSHRIYNWRSPNIKVNIQSLFSKTFPSSANTLIGDSENAIRLTLSADCRDSQFIIREFNMKFIKSTCYKRHNSGTDIDYIYYLSNIKAESEQLDSVIQTFYVKDGTAYLRWNFKVKVKFSAKLYMSEESLPYDLKYELIVNCTVNNELDIPMTPGSYRIAWMQSDDIVVFKRMTDSKLDNPPLGIMRRDGCRLLDPVKLYGLYDLGNGLFNVALEEFIEVPATAQQKFNQTYNSYALFSVRDGQITDTLYREINPPHDGLVQICDSNFNIGYISQRGKIIIDPDPIYGTRFCSPPYGAGLVGYYKFEKLKISSPMVPTGYILKEKVGMKNLDGKTVISPIYEDLSHPANGLIIGQLIKNGGPSYYIDYTGARLDSPQQLNTFYFYSLKSEPRDKDYKLLHHPFRHTEPRILVDSYCYEVKIPDVRKAPYIPYSCRYFTAHRFVPIKGSQVYKTEYGVSDLNQNMITPMSYRGDIKINDHGIAICPMFDADLDSCVTPEMRAKRCYFGLPPINDTTMTCVYDLDTHEILFTCSTSTELWPINKNLYAVFHRETAFPCVIWNRRLNRAVQELSKMGWGFSSPSRKYDYLYFLNGSSDIFRTRDVIELWENGESIPMSR